MIPWDHRPGWFSDLSRAAKSGVSIPVLVTGGIKTGEEAEQVLLRGDADLVGVGRAMLKDADWAEKNI